MCESLRTTAMPQLTPKQQIRDLETLADLERVLHLEKEVWGLADADDTPLTLAAALKAAGSIWLGAFDANELVGFALAFPSLEHGKPAFILICWRCAPRIAAKISATN